jgi:voltage-gated potassium channel Kch
MLVVTLDDPEDIDRMVPLMRQYFPTLPIHARAIDRQHCADLISQGVTSTVSETLEISLRLTEEILLGSGINQVDAKKAIKEFRTDYYEDVVQKVTDHKVVMGELKH